MSKKKKGNMLFGVVLIIFCLLISAVICFIKGKEDEFYRNSKVTTGVISKIDYKDFYAVYKIDDVEYNNIIVWGTVHNLQENSSVDIYYNKDNHNEIGVYKEEHIINDIIAIILLIMLFVLGILFIVFSI